MSLEPDLTSDNPLLSEASGSLIQAAEFAVDCKNPVSEPEKFAVNCTDQRVAAFVEAALAANTRRAYASDLKHFAAWGGSIPATPAEIARYLADHAEMLTPATLARHLVAIGQLHRASGHADPTRSELIRLTFRGIRRTFGTAQRQAAPLTKGQLIRVLDFMGPSTRDVRDRAVLLVGFAGAFRRSELSSLDLQHLERRDGGLVITIRRGKSDQEGRGRIIAIPVGRDLKPVAALDAWLAASGLLREGPVFRPISRGGEIGRGRLSAEAIALIIKRRVAAAGLDPSRYTGHSLRAGFATSAAARGVERPLIRRQTGHATDGMLERYIREGELFGETALNDVL